jgi:sigma-B regulation protein RsbQ
VSSNHPSSRVAHRHHLNVMGTGAVTLLMVHGYGCNQTMWRHVASALANDFRVALVDLVGFGLSDHSAYDPQRHAGLQGHAQDLVDVAALLADQPVVVVGHSVGASIGLLAETLDPRAFAGHVMVSPSPCFFDDGEYVGGTTHEDLRALLRLQAEDMQAWAQQVASLVVAEPAWGALAGELVASFCRARPEAAAQLAQATFLGDYRPLLEEVRKPTLLLQSMHDAIAPVAVGSYMQEKIPGSRLQLLAGSGHCPHLTQPAQCVEAMLRFLRTLPLPVGSTVPVTLH